MPTVGRDAILEMLATNLATSSTDDEVLLPLKCLNFTGLECLAECGFAKLRANYTEPNKVE
jgi:hypothetical protein